MNWLEIKIYTTTEGIEHIGGMLLMAGVNGYAVEDKNLRLTFDTNIRFRTKDFDMSKGDFGRVILDESEMLLEIKAAGAMPMWLINALSDMKIYPTSFSKYGTAYKLMLSEQLNNLSEDKAELKI